MERNNSTKDLYCLDCVYCERHVSLQDNRCKKGTLRGKIYCHNCTGGYHLCFDCVNQNSVFRDEQLYLDRIANSYVFTDMDKCLICKHKQKKLDSKKVVNQFLIYLRQSLKLLEKQHISTKSSFMGIL